MTLYFDIGNTSIKLNFRINDFDYYVSYNTNKDYSIDSFYKELPKELKELKITKTMISSVVPRVEELIVGVIKKYWQLNPIILEPPLKTGIKISADNPKGVGADLIALSAFISSKTNNGIMINMGTATTIIKVVKDTLVGTIISPGLGISFDALIKNASRLSNLKLKIPKTNLGKNTADSISLGIIKGHAKMIEGLVEEIKDKDTKIFLSGGYSKRVMELLPHYNWVKEATIEGLKVIEKRNNG